MDTAGTVRDVDVLDALVVDDEQPALEELTFLLREDPRIRTIWTASNVGQALRVLSEQPIDVLLCDVKMPGLDGVELGRIVSRFADRPRVIFVTAYDDRAVEAFELQAVDYVMKPVSADRLSEAVRRAARADTRTVSVDEEETIPVELAGVTRFVRRSQILFVEAQGDYARLHTATGSHLLRCPLAELEARWSGAGFARIHRSTLVALEHVDEVRTTDGRCSVRIGLQELPVSRRHTRDLREQLTRR